MGDESKQNEPYIGAMGVGCFILAPGLIVLLIGSFLSGGFFVPQASADGVQFWGKVISAAGALLILVGAAWGAVSTKKSGSGDFE